MLTSETLNRAQCLRNTTVNFKFCFFTLLPTCSKVISVVRARLSSTFSYRGGSGLSVSD